MSIISLFCLGGWVKIFIETFCIIYHARIYDSWWPLWYYQTFLSIIFQLYRVVQLYFLGKLEYWGKPSTSHKLLAQFIIDSCIEYTWPWAGFERIVLEVICTDCTCSWKSTYHMITTAMDLSSILTDIWCQLFN